MSLKDNLLECITIRDRLERNIDWSYCHKRAHEYDCADKFEEIQRSAKKIKKQMDEQKNDI